MGIRFSTVRLLAEILPEIGALSDRRLLTLGVQDCYFSYEEIVVFLQRHRLTYRATKREDIELTKGFKWVPAEDAHLYRQYIHQRTFFSLLGFSNSNVTALDASNYEGAELVHDLNIPIDQAHHGQYDFIIDCGTLHYVFSVKDALFNVARLCKVGGVIVNFNPLDYSDKGFIGLNAELFRDFYRSNGFEELSLKYIAMPVHEQRINQYYLEFSPEATTYLFRPYYTTSVYAVYRKVEEKDLHAPIQGIYARLHARTCSEHERQSSWRRKGLSRLIHNVIDSHYLLAVILHNLLCLRFGKRVNL